MPSSSMLQNVASRRSPLTTSFQTPHVEEHPAGNHQHRVSRSDRDRTPRPGRGQLRWRSGLSGIVTRARLPVPARRLVPRQEGVVGERDDRDDRQCRRRGLQRGRGDAPRIGWVDRDRRRELLQEKDCTDTLFQPGRYWCAYVQGGTTATPWATTTTGRSSCRRWAAPRWPGRDRRSVRRSPRRRSPELGFRCSGSRRRTVVA